MLVTVVGLDGTPTSVSSSPFRFLHPVLSFAPTDPGAKELAAAYKGAGNPSQVRGIATNVAGWNAWSKTPGEFENATDGKYNKAHDEKRYVNLIGPALKKAGMPGNAIVDTGRNAVQGLRKEWGDWCNVNGAGFGARPTGSTGDSLTDALRLGQARW